MRIFVSEFIAGGGLAASPLPDSLLREGRAMLGSVVADLLAIPGCHVVTTQDARLQGSSPLPTSPLFEVEYVYDPAQERTAFERHCVGSDATLVIAPETGGELAQRVQRVVDLDRPTLNCTVPAIDLCGDKLNLAEHFLSRSIATIPTQVVQEHRNLRDVFACDCVVKPRDGAGSWLTFLVAHGDSAAWEHVQGELKTAGVYDRAIIQPYIAGMPLSVGCLCDGAGSVELLPVARQSVSAPNFQYQGGRLPVDLDRATVAAIHELMQSACASIQGLRGYVGIDLLLPDADPTKPLIVEINPRLTTSYVGYRALCCSNLAERMLAIAFAEKLPSPLDWRSGTVEFDAAGNCQYQANKD